MKIGPSFKYRFGEFLRGIIIFLLIYILAMTSFLISITVNSGTGYFSGYEISAVITVFVFGIVQVRDDLRLGIQNGVGRRSVFLASLLSMMLVSLILAATGDLIVMVAQRFTLSGNRMHASGLYQMLFTNDFEWFNAPLLMHIRNVLFTSVLLIAANNAGSFISLVFYRLNKPWTLIVAVGSPIFLFWILPMLLARSNIDVGAFIAKLVITPASITAFFAAVAALVAVFNYLLVRRAPIKAQVK